MLKAQIYYAPENIVEHYRRLYTTHQHEKPTFSQSYVSLTEMVLVLLVQYFLRGKMFSWDSLVYFKGAFDVPNFSLTSFL